MEDLTDEERDDKENKKFKDDLKHEYKDVSDNIRHYGNIEFAAITAFVAITTGFLAVFFTFDSSQTHLPPLVKCILPYIGLSIVIAFMAIIESAMYLWWLFVKRAIKLENVLGYDQYSTLIVPIEIRSFPYKKWSIRWHCFQFFMFFYRIRPTMWGIRIFYFGIFIFWLHMINQMVWRWLPYTFIIIIIGWLVKIKWSKKYCEVSSTVEKLPKIEG